MSAFTLPSNLAAALREEPGEGFAEWVAGLPRTVRHLAGRWSLRVGEPFQPGGRSAWVAPATDAAGRDVVLKIGWPHYEADHEPDGLRCWDGRGAIRLDAVDGPTGALLLERCRPGTALTVLPEPDQDVVLAALLPRLWLTPPAGHPFRPLLGMCEQWADGAEERFARSPELIDPGLARAGIHLLRSLPATAGREVLLCTDLHAGNVLAAEREPWLMIDPKPYLGDPAYDVLQHLLNCRSRLSADPAGTALRMAGLLDLDPQRVLQWLFARSVHLSPQWPWLAPVAVTLAGVLEA